MVTRTAVCGIGNAECLFAVMADAAVFSQLDHLGMRRGAFFPEILDGFHPEDLGMAFNATLLLPFGMGPVIEDDRQCALFGLQGDGTGIITAFDHVLQCR